MKHVHILFFVKVLAFSFLCVALYVLIANVIAYLLIRRRNDKRFFEVMQKSFLKLPCLLTFYGFIAGIAAYLWGALVVGSLFGSDSQPSIPSERTQMDGSEVSLIMFILLGFSVSVVVGWIVFYRAFNFLKKSEGKFDNLSK